MLSKQQHIIKRIFDIIFSIIGLLIFIIPIFISVIFASFSTKSFGIFFQERIGQYGKPFTIFKIKTMYDNIYVNGNRKTTPFGKILSRSKLNELPQFFNVLFGTMSLVGPRPDIKGYADKLIGDARIILTVKPGVTGPATLKYSKEDEILANQENPLEYNDTVIWPDKVEINKEYVQNWNLLKDIRYLLRTVRS